MYITFICYLFDYIFEMYEYKIALFARHKFIAQQWQFDESAEIRRIGPEHRNRRISSTDRRTTILSIQLYSIEGFRFHVSGHNSRPGPSRTRGQKSVEKSSRVWPANGYRVGCKTACFRHRFLRRPLTPIASSPPYPPCQTPRSDNKERKISVLKRSVQKVAWLSQRNPVIFHAEA